MIKRKPNNRRKKYFHFRYQEDKSGNVELVLSDNTTLCKNTIYVVIRNVKFCICNPIKNPTMLKRFVKQNTEKLELHSKNQLHISYLYSLIFRFMANNSHKIIRSITISSNSHLSAYYICKSIKLEFNIPIGINIPNLTTLQKVNGSRSHLFMEMLEQFVNNSDSSRSEVNSYPDYEINSKTQEIVYEGDGRLSVVIPTTLHSENMLIKTLESLRSSTIKIEKLILVIPDRAELPDRVKALLEEFSSHEVLMGSQSGVGRARFIGIEKVTTQYVAFIDDDDLVEPSYLEILLTAHKFSKNLAAVGSWLQSFGDSRFKIPQFDNLPLFGIVGCLPPAGVLMWNRSAILNLGNFDPEFDRGFEDFQLTSKASALSYKIAVIDRPLYKYRRHQNSTSSAYTLAFERQMRQKVLSATLDANPEIAPVIAILLYGANSSIYESSPFYWKNEIGGRDKLRKSKSARRLYNLLPYSLRRILQVILRYI